MEMNYVIRVSCYEKFILRIFFGRYNNGLSMADQFVLNSISSSNLLFNVLPWFKELDNAAYFLPSFYTFHGFFKCFSDAALIIGISFLEQHLIYRKYDSTWDENFKNYVLSIFIFLGHAIFFKHTFPYILTYWVDRNKLLFQRHWLTICFHY